MEWLNKSRSEEYFASSKNEEVVCPKCGKKARGYVKTKAWNRILWCFFHMDLEKLMISECHGVDMIE